MWYFAWILGVAMAVLLAIVNAVYGENHGLHSEDTQQEENR